VVIAKRRRRGMETGNEKCENLFQTTLVIAKRRRHGM
jgi:hypothetical protein